MIPRRFLPLLAVPALLLPAGAAAASPSDGVLSEVRELLAAVGAPVPGTAAVGADDEIDDEGDLDTEEQDDETAEDSEPSADIEEVEPEDVDADDTEDTEDTDESDDVEDPDRVEGSDTEADEGPEHGMIVSTVARCAPRGAGVYAATGVANHGAFVSAAARGEAEFETDLGTFDLSTLEGAEGLCEAVGSDTDESADTDEEADRLDDDAEDDDTALTSSSADDDSSGPPAWTPGAAARDQRPDDGAEIEDARRPGPPSNPGGQGRGRPGGR